MAGPVSWGIMSFGRALASCGFGLILLSAVAGLVLCLKAVASAAGLGAAVLAALLAPLTYALVPLYAGLAQGDWLPALCVYGASTLGLPMILAGKALAGDYAERSIVRDPAAVRLALAALSAGALLLLGLVLQAGQAASP